MDVKFNTTLREVCLGEAAAAMVTITAVKGSTPRKPGAKMLVLPDGQVYGTIGGGCGEADVRREALNALTELTPTKYMVNMTNDIAEEEGMVCGGLMEVFIDIIKPQANPEKVLLSGYLDSLEASEQPVLVTVTHSPENPHLFGRKCYFTAGAKRYGDLGDEDLNNLAGELADQVRSAGKIRLVRTTALPAKPEFELLLEPAPAPVELLILGGGHIAKPLAAMAAILGYRVTVVDDRPAFANSARFPGASRVICQDFGRALQDLEIGPTAFIVIVTRGHRHDKVCLKAVVSQPTAYLGMIGSRRRVKALLAELLEEGIPAGQVERIHSPIGLNIGAETPEEIAVSILAELINVHRDGKAQSLKITTDA
ncbi:MAG: XdhC family protein [Thermincola sp.]|jgi:xanthine dehydrogenase accessory factor|nr:XdhC family protein [Thermincola sp.]MDT3701833.1 XdhC family protein [Thermincola sp.]